MLVCGVELKASEAFLALVQSNPDQISHVPSQTKRLRLEDDRDSSALEILKKAIEAFSHQYGVEIFVIKSRNKSGQMAGGAVSFKIETLFQLSGTPVVFVSPQALSKFSKTNMGGVPETVLGYQKEAFRSGALHLSKMEEL